MKSVKISRIEFMDNLIKNELHKRKAIAICFSDVCNHGRHQASASGIIKDISHLYDGLCPDCYDALYWVNPRTQDSELHHYNLNVLRTAFRKLSNMGQRSLETRCV